MVKAARERPRPPAASWKTSRSSSHRSCRAVWAAPALGGKASTSAGSAARSRLHTNAPRLGRVPHEGVPRAIQDLSAGSTNRHDRSQDGSVKAGGDQSGQEFAVDSNDADSRVVTAEVDRIGPDESLIAAHLLVGTGGRLRNDDKRLRTEAETDESEPIYREAIARDVVPLGVGLKRRLARLDDRRRRPLGDGGRGRAQSAHGEQGNREAQREQYDE